MSPHLYSRQNDQCAFTGDCGYNDGEGDFWGSDEGYYIRYAVVAAIIGFVLILLLIAYVHAQRRIKRGQAPLRYHAWLVRNRFRNTNPNGNIQYPYSGAAAPGGTYAYYGNNQQPPPSSTIPMESWQQQGGGHQPTGWAPPPPAYGQHQWESPPVYQPPPGGSKASADQNVRDVDREVGEGSSGVAAPAPTHQPEGDHQRNEHIVTQ